MAKARTITCVGCGADIPVPGDDDPRWSVHTQTKRNREVVVERHAALDCPDCGTTEKWFYEDLVVQGGKDDGKVLHAAPWAAYNLVVEKIADVALKDYMDGRYDHG